MTPSTAAFLTSNPWATLTGDQRDDDNDGYGNKCNGKFPGVLGIFLHDGDLTELRASNAKNRTFDLCGTPKRARARSSTSTKADCSSATAT